MQKDDVKRIAETFQSAGAEIFIVGGAVRDFLLQKEVKDIDFELYSLNAEKVLEICQALGKADIVGQSYGVIKLTIDNKTYDIALPRTERKTGNKHTDFIVNADPFMNKENACRRRDISINAMMMNPLTDEILDFFGGREDIKNKVIRHVDAKTFVEDSLRVLRAAQFAARFNFIIADDTLKLCQGIDLADLPAERIKEEVFKLLLKSDKPSIGIKALNLIGVSAKLFNSLFTDDKVYYELLDNAALTANSFNHVEVKLAILLSALMFKFSAEEVEFVCDKLDLHTYNNYKLRNQLLLVNKFQQYPYTMERTRKNYNHLVNTGIDIGLLAAVYKLFNHENSSGFYNTFLGLRIPVKNGKVRAIIEGSHLLEMGFEAGPQMGLILKDVYQKQLDDEIQSLDEAFKYVKAIWK